MRGLAGRTLLSTTVALAVLLGSVMLAAAAPKGGGGGGGQGGGGGGGEPPAVVASDLSCTGCVDTTDIDDGAVTDDKIGGVDTGKLSGDELDVSLIPDLDADTITSGTFGSARIANGAVTTQKQLARALFSNGQGGSVGSGGGFTTQAVPLTFGGGDAPHLLLVLGQATIASNSSLPATVAYRLEASQDGGASWTTIGLTRSVTVAPTEMVPIHLFEGFAPNGGNGHFRLRVTTDEPVNVAAAGVAAIDLGRVL